MRVGIPPTLVSPTTHHLASLGPVSQPSDLFVRSSHLYNNVVHNTAGRRRDDKLAKYAEAALQQRGFKTEFDSQALQQVTGVPATDFDPSIKNLQHLPWLSTDNRGTLNAEQLTVAEKLPGGQIRVRVAVSDVDAAVPEGSPLDLHARQNGQAIYAPGKNFPMLPWDLLDHQTSFRPNEERLAVVTEFVVEQDGTIAEFDCYRARVESHGKLAFPKVDGWMQGRFPGSQEGQQMRIQAEAGGRLSREREEHELVGLSQHERPARDLIQELMNTANEVTVQYLESKNYPVLYQTKSKPQRWGRIRDLAQREGYTLPKDPSSSGLRKFLAQRKSQMNEHEYAELSISVDKLLGVSYLAVKPAGEDYPEDFRLNAHESARATSPSRNYAALTVQRMLKGAIAGEAPDFEKLDELALHCNKRSDDAYRAKRQVYKSKDALRLSSKIGQRFDGVITGSSKKGVWVKLRGQKVEGKVVNGHQGLDVGDRVRVRLKHVNPDRGHIDFELEKR